MKRQAFYIAPAFERRKSFCLERRGGERTFRPLSVAVYGTYCRIIDFFPVFLVADSDFYCSGCLAESVELKKAFVCLQIFVFAYAVSSYVRVVAGYTEYIVSSRL